MKNSILLFTGIISLCFFSKVSFTQTYDWLWAKSADGNDYDEIYSVDVDAAGNSYIAGWFESSSFIFGSTTLTNAGWGDMFIAKFDVNGNVLWAKSAGGTGGDEALSITIDASGNIYVAGAFYSPTITFGTTTLTNAGGTSNSYDFFLVKYDTNGNVLWAKSAGGTGDDLASSVAVNAIGNIYSSGNFNSSTISFGITTLTNAGGGANDFFIAKYDTNGNVIWAQSAGGAGHDDLSYSVTVDAVGNAYMTGGFPSTTITFDTTTLTNAGGADIYLTKYNNNGDVVWAKSMGGTGWEYARSVAVDAAGNVYITGYFESPTITFNSINLINSGSMDILLAKYDTNGNELWAITADGMDWDEARSVVLDTIGNPYIAGYFYSPVITLGSITLPNSGSIDIFLAKYDTNGNVIFAKKAGGSNGDKAFSITLDGIGNIYLAGSYISNTITFGSTTLTNTGVEDIFLAKLISITGIYEMTYKPVISVFPNPSSDKITIIVPYNATLEIANINGQIIKTIIHDSGETSVDIGDLSSGVYIIKTKTDKEIVTNKFIKE